MKFFFGASILLGLFHLSYQLDCTAINNNDQVAGRIIRIPENSQVPVDVPPNFKCVYTISPPKTVFAQLTISSGLAGVDDVIMVTDWQGKATKLDRNSQFPNVIYVVPGTASTVNVTIGSAVGSKLLLTVSYIQLPAPSQVTLQKNSRLLSNFMLSDIQRKPVTVVTDEKILLTLAQSGHPFVDKFENYYVIDGDLNNSQSIKSFADLSKFNFQSTGNILTFVGLDNSTQFASVIVTPLSETSGYKYAGITVKDNGIISVGVRNGEKAALVVVARDAEQLVLTSLTQDKTGNCQVLSQTGAPNSASMELMTFNSDYASIPQLFPYKFFSFTVLNCHANFHFTTATPKGYYDLTAPQNGYIFSPSYFAPGVKADFNVTYTYTGSERMQFSVDVDKITGSSNGGDQLDVNIYDDSWRKTLSTVITGNQEGTRSRAFGKYLNVKMSGSGTARLRYMLTQAAFSGFSSFSTALLLVVMWILM